MKYPTEFSWAKEVEKQPKCRKISIEKMMGALFIAKIPESRANFKPF
jgi:hypothetical protein